MNDLVPSPSEAQPVDATPAVEEPATVDLEPIARDLADAEASLARLDVGTYWMSEISGAELPDELLAGNPVARRLPGE